MNIGSLKILVAEDNTLNIRVAEFNLKPLAATIDVVRDGEEVLQKLQTESYDVIFMDLQMPKLDGFQTTLKIRAKEKASNKQPTPIIALTANNRAEDMDYCKEIGMDGFLLKPFNTDDVKEILENIL